jgi:hypothetical protein
MNPEVTKSRNPESGDHGITSDPMEVKAVDQVLANPLHKSVYLLWRFGERGERFGVSDALWIAKVGRQEMDEVAHDLKWLRNVLASRGVPYTILARFILDYNLAIESIDGANRQTARRLLAVMSQWELEMTRFKSSQRGKFWLQEIEKYVSVLPTSLQAEFHELLLASYMDQQNSFGNTYNSIATWIGENVVFNSEWTTAVLALGPKESESQ